jgi:ABC-2 type transport system permease protein
VRARATDRGSWLLVTKREFWVRLRDRGFLISTSITVLVLSGFIVANALGSGTAPAFRLAVVGPDARAIGQAALPVAKDNGATLTLVDAATAGAAEQLVRSGDVDAALADGTLKVKTEPPALLQQIVNEAHRRVLVRQTLAQTGLTGGEVDAVLNPPTLEVDPLETVPNEQRKLNSTVAFVALLLLYGQLFGYGVWVASGVVEEKSSRVVEVLLAAVRARQLMAGKVLGIGLLGLLQLTFIGAIAVSLSLATGVLKVPGQAILTVLVTLFWFALGFGFYASLFAVAGALVSRMEELQNAIVPLNLTILGSFFLSIGAVNDPNSTLAKVASLVPLSSPFAMPPRIALGAATVPEALTSIALLVGATAIAIPFAGRLYAGAILRIGARVKLRDAWRATR